MSKHVAVWIAQRDCCDVYTVVVLIVRLVVIVKIIKDTRYMRRVLVGKPEGKRPLGRPKHRW
jgi:hypothetical protein